MKEYFLAVTANILDEEIVQSAEKTMGEKITDKTDALILMDLYNKEEFDYFIERFKYVTGKSVIVFIDPDKSCCTLYRYGYPDDISDIMDAVIPAIEDSYQSMTGEILIIKEMIDKREDLKMDVIGNLN